MDYMSITITEHLACLWVKMSPGVRPYLGRSGVVMCGVAGVFLSSTSFILYLCDVTNLVGVSGWGFIAHWGLPDTKLSQRDFYLQHKRFMAEKITGSQVYGWKLF